MSCVLSGHDRIGTSPLVRHISDPLLGEKPIHRHTLYLCVTGDWFSGVT